MVKSGPIFDIKKLQWMNGKYIREKMNETELITVLEPFLPQEFPEGLLPKVLPLIKDRLVTLTDIGPLTELFYIETAPSKADLVGKKGTSEAAKSYLQAAKTQLEQVSEWKAA